MDRISTSTDEERISTWRRDADDTRRRHSRSRSRERDRGYYSQWRNRSRSRDRDYRSRSHSKERESSYRCERSHSKESDRLRYLGSRSQEKRWDRDDKQSSRSRDEKARGWEHRSRKSRDEDHWSRYSTEETIEELSPVLMLRNLKEEVRKEDISRAIGVDMSFVKDIRLVQRSWKERNQGFAFLEFYQAHDASRWLDQHKDNFQVLGSMVDIDYSRQRQIGEKKPQSDDRDWSCFKCGTLNFARRRVCMTCDCPKTESENLHADVREGRLVNSSSDDKKFGSEGEERNPPSNVLILRGMDALSDENSVRSAIAKVHTGSLKEVRLIRDKATNTSRGFCFVELNSVDEAKQLLEVIQNQYPAFFVDGRRLIVNYARQMYPANTQTVSSSVASAAIAQAQWSMQSLAMMKSAKVASQPPVQQTSIQQANPQVVGITAELQATTMTTLTTATGGGQTQQKLPSTYSYDPTSGFYYDSATGLYYDPKTQYHYNSQTGHYCYYDPQQQAYISVDQLGNAIPSSSVTTATSTTSGTDVPQTTVKTKKNVLTSSSTPSAKKIAKDMERWAKSVNAAKAVQQQQLQAVIKADAHVAASAPDAINSLSLATADLSTKGGIALMAALMESEEDRPSLAAHAADVAEPVASHFPVPSGMDVNPAHTDWNQLACLLCKRKFPSRQTLIKHQQFSELHKQNLAKEKSQGDQSFEAKYRDRAKERRDKYGSPAIVPGWKKRLEREMASAESEIPIPFEQPTAEGLQKDNIGSKMLQAMGWSEGQGLGKSNQGIVEPVKAEQRLVGAGLGAPGSKMLYSSAGTYRDTLKQLTRARYEGTFQ